MRRLQAIAQNGLLYATDPFDRERFEEVRAIAAEMASGDDDHEDVLAAFTAEAGHATPKVDVRAAAFRDGRVLLVCGADDGLWTLPGGWCEVGEAPSVAAEKELREESGYTGRAVKLVALYNRDVRDRPRWPFHAYKLVFLCELSDGEPGAPHADEVTGVRFFAVDELPELSERVRRDQVKRAFAHARDPTLPADFD